MRLFYRSAFVVVCSILNDRIQAGAWQKSDLNPLHHREKIIDHSTAVLSTSARRGRSSSTSSIATGASSTTASHRSFTHSFLETSDERRVPLSTSPLERESAAGSPMMMASSPPRERSPPAHEERIGPGRLLRHVKAKIRSAIGRTRRSVLDYVASFLQMVPLAAALPMLMTMASSMGGKTVTSWRPGRGGLPGKPGEQGDAAAPGDVGTPGAKALSGVSGVDAPTGKQGAGGDTGPAGTAGSQGMAGGKGPSGHHGADGEVGDRGAAGLEGREAMPGVEGHGGIQGNRGRPGPAGEPGENLRILLKKDPRTGILPKFLGG